MNCFSVVRSLRFGRTEDFDLGDALDVPDEFVFVFLSIHSRPRTSAERLNLGDEHRWTVAGQESVDLGAQQGFVAQRAHALQAGGFGDPGNVRPGRGLTAWTRSEEHTSELQSQFHLVCRLL